MNNKWFFLNFQKNFGDFKGINYWISCRKTQKDRRNWTPQVPQNVLVFLISFFERERTSVRHVNQNWFFWVKKVTTFVRLIFPHYVKKAKINNATNTGLFCIPKLGKHAIQKVGNVLFGKKLRCVFKNWNSEAFRIFWRTTILGGKKVALKRNHYVKTVQRCDVLIRYRFFLICISIRQRSLYHSHPTASWRYNQVEQFQEGDYFSLFLIVSQCWARKF